MSVMKAEDFRLLIFIQKSMKMNVREMRNKLVFEVKKRISTPLELIGNRKGAKNMPLFSI